MKISSASVMNNYRGSQSGHRLPPNLLLSDGMALGIIFDMRAPRLEQCISVGQE